MMAAGLDSSPSIKLIFGDTSLEFPFRADGNLEVLGAEVQAKLGLQPDSFTISDDFGKVTDSAALQRALDMAGESPCTLEVHEVPAWRKIREMDAKINMLIARCPVVDNCLQIVEERSAKRFEKLASLMEAVEHRSVLRSEVLCQGLEELDKKVTNSIAPLLRCVALQEMELKAKLDNLSMSMTSEDMATKVNCTIAPMLQSMAFQQMDLKEKLDSLAAPSTCKHCEKLEDKVDEVEAVAKDLQKAMDIKSDSLEDVCTQLKALRSEVHNRAEQPSIQCDSAMQTWSAMRQDLMMSPKANKNGLGGMGGDEWIEGTSWDFLSPVAYSKKSQTGVACNSTSLRGAGAMPVARFTATRQLDRSHGARSLPHLPYVK